jgi:hypothetical protein
MWAAQHDMWMLRLVHLPARMVVVQLHDDSLLLHSAIPIDDALAAALAELGPVEHIVAPSRLHHLFVTPAQARYPQAKVWGAPGLPDKRPDIRLDGVLTQDDVPWAETFSPLRIEGAPEIEEVVFLHRPSKTFVCSDLVFNLQTVRGLLSPWVFRMMGTHKRLANSRMWRGKIRDHDAAARSVEALLEWNFDRVVMGHGEIVPTGGHAALTQALAPLRRNQ